MKKWAHELNVEFSKEEIKMASKYMKKSSTSLAIRYENHNYTKISTFPSYNAHIQEQ
jgi:hypothetical protein